MQKTFIVAAITLIAGLGAGYAYGSGKQTPPPPLPPPPPAAHDHQSMTMDDMMHAMNTELRGKTGTEFDRAFLTEMIAHHEGAVEMAEQALLYAERQEIKDLANAIIEAQNQEIADMRSWQ